MRSIWNVSNVLVMEIDRFDPTPIYKQVARVVRAKIESGELRPRDPIPSESKMVADYGVGKFPVMSKSVRNPTVDGK